MTRRKAPEVCPCGSGRPLADCCGPLIGAAVAAPTAEALMRSRYTAYVLGQEAYLLATWHATTRPAAVDLREEPRPRWIGLDIRRHEQRDGAHAEVEFVARYRLGGRAHGLHETSRFLREGGSWFYVDGDLHE